MISETPVGVEPGGGADSPRGQATAGGNAAHGGPATGGLSPGGAVTGGAAFDAPSTGSVLRFLAAALRAKSVVDVRTGSGDNARCLLEGMRSDGLLTSIDVDPNAQRHARERLSNAGVSNSRVRLISGRAQDVLSRLAEEAYDLVFVDDRETEYPEYLRSGLRLLRSGGVLVFARVSSGGRMPLPEPSRAAIHELIQRIETEQKLIPTTLPVGNGLLAIARW